MHASRLVGVMELSNPPPPPPLPLPLPTSHYPSPFSSNHHFSPPSTTWKHDVFLSFSGKDCRGKFCDDLYEALQKDHVKVYMDDKNLRRGSKIEPELLQAIEQSRISIVILSRHYAFSRYCLDELNAILRYINDKRHTALPLFLKVTTDDVKKQGGDYKLAFERHEKRVRGKQYKKQKRILEWRLA
ncbi:hypothetical protein Tsubulata_050749, partial [Turnera subulata]